MKAGYGYTIGRRHAAEQDPELCLCQDVAASYSDEDLTIIAVADGKAGKNAPAAAVAAAQVNIDTIIAFFRDPATWRIAEKNDFKESALRMLEGSLETVAGGEEFALSELRATISAVAVRSNGEFLALSIGDGTVVAFDQDLNPSVLIPPYREGGKNRTVYTNDPDGARDHMAAWGGTLDQSEFLAFALFTDGADYLTRRMVDGTGILRTAAACTLFGSGDEYIREAISEIAAEHSRDDVALAVVIDETEDAYAVAKNVLLEARAAKEDSDTAAEVQEILAEPIDSEAYHDTFDDAEGFDEELEDLPHPPMPEQLSEEDTDASEDADDFEEEVFEAEPTPYEVTVLRAVYAEPRTAQALVEEGCIPEGRVLETVIPLLRCRRIRYENGQFVPCE